MALLIDEEKEKIISSQELRTELAEDKKLPFFKSGNVHLDELIGGFMAGDMIILGGSPKAGKTSLLQTWTRQFASQDIPCLWFSVELSHREFLGRFGDRLPIFYLPRVLPSQTTHLWIEKKILEAKTKFDIKVVFIDHIGMIADETMYRERNSVEILDARLARLKQFAIANQVCLICVAPFVAQATRKLKTEPSTGDFKGTSGIGYTADTLLGLDRNTGRQRTVTVNEEEESGAMVLAGSPLIATDSFLYVLDCRRSGARKIRIKLKLVDGDLLEA